MNQFLKRSHVDRLAPHLKLLSLKLRACSKEDTYSLMTNEGYNVYSSAWEVDWAGVFELARTAC